MCCLIVIVINIAGHRYLDVLHIKVLFYDLNIMLHLVLNTNIHLCLCWNILSLVSPSDVTVENCITNMNAYIAILLSVPALTANLN